MNETAWAYFNGEDGSKSLYFRDHPWPIYLLFSILIVGAVFNLFLIWLINTRMDLAHVIKGLLSVECSFRLMGCMITNSLRGAFLLWGWQPSFFIDMIVILEKVLGKHRMSPDTLNPFLLEENQTYFYNTSSPSDLFESYFNLSSHSNASNGKDNEALSLLTPTIEYVCFLPASLTMLTNYGIAIFVLLTGVVRYVYVKTEQAGNQTTLLNRSCTTYVFIICGLVLTVFHWICVWMFIPSNQLRFDQACLRPNDVPVELSRVTELSFIPITIYNILIPVVYAVLFWYVYKEDQNTRVIELQRPVAEQIVQGDERTNAQPTRKHVFTAGFGLAHFTTMIIIFFTHIVLAKGTHLTNSEQMCCVLIVISFFNGIFSPMMVIWSSTDARNQCRNVLDDITSSLQSTITCCVSGVRNKCVFFGGRNQTGPSHEFDATTNDRESNNIRRDHGVQQNDLHALPMKRLRQNYFTNQRDHVATSRARIEKPKIVYSRNRIGTSINAPSPLTINTSNGRESNSIRRSPGIRQNNRHIRPIKPHTQNYLTNQSNDAGSSRAKMERSNETQMHRTIKRRKCSLESSKEPNQEREVLPHQLHRNFVSEPNLVESERTLNKTLRNILQHYDYRPATKFMKNHATSPTVSGSSSLRSCLNRGKTFTSNKQLPKANKDVITAPTVPFKEIILSLKDTQYNGCELPDPVTKMKGTFTASLSPNDDGQVIK